MWFTNSHKLQRSINAVISILEGLLLQNQTISGKLTKMSQELDALKAQVAASVALNTTTATLIGSLAEKVANAGGDTAALKEVNDQLVSLTADLKTSSDALAAVVAANSPTV